MSRISTAHHFSTDKLVNLSDSEVLKLRFKDLALSIAGSDIEKYVTQLKLELEIKKLNFSPQIFLGDEWFSPEGMNAISVPFFLVNSRLRSLEKHMMLELEGGTEEWFMKLLRHEAGHCFDHCFKFSKRKKWQKIFGSPNLEYKPETYRPQPFSKSYVKHLDRWYAQAHPDEDFAETFAVWLTPNLNWNKEYAQWPVALGKLNYISELVNESLKLKNTAEVGRFPSAISNLSTTLQKYYIKKKNEFADDYPDFYDVDLKLIFNKLDETSKKDIFAHQFMKKHRKQIVGTVAWATNEKKFTIDLLVKRLILRCQKLDLKLGKSELQTTMEVSCFLTSLVKNYLFTGKFKRTA